MALDAATVWEVRGATGDDTFGGGWNDRGGSSTDYSQQDAAQLSLTDCATSGVGVTTLTSATGGFTAAMVGNLINLSAGTNLTAGFYEITAHTDTNTVTLDRAPDNGGGGVSAATGKVGGALATLSAVEPPAVDGNFIYVKAATYTETLTITKTAANNTARRWVGYATSRNDDPVGEDRPIIDGQSSRANCVNTGASTTIGGDIFTHFIFENATSHGFGGGSGRDFAFVSVLSRNNVGNGFLVNAGCGFHKCEASGNTLRGFESSANDIGLAACYSHDNAGVGVQNANALMLSHCVIEANASAGALNFGGGCSLVSNCTVNGNTGATTDGLLVTNNGRNVVPIANTIMSNNGQYGLNKPSRWVIESENCYFGNGTAAKSGTGTTVFVENGGDVLADPLMTDPASGDFSLQAGSPCRETGFPGTMPGGLSVGLADIGAIPSGGGGAAELLQGAKIALAGRAT